MLKRFFVAAALISVVHLAAAVTTSTPGPTVPPANSVGTLQLIDGGVTSAKIAPPTGVDGGSCGSATSSCVEMLNGSGQVLVIGDVPIALPLDGGAFLGILPYAHGGTNNDETPPAGSVAINDGTKLSYLDAGYGVLHEDGGTSYWGPVVLDGGEVYGVLPYTHGGTNNDAVPPAGSVAVNNGTKLSYLDAGYGLLHEDAGLVYWGPVDLATNDVTGLLPYTDLVAGSSDGTLLYSLGSWSTPVVPGCTADTCCINFDNAVHTWGSNTAVNAAKLNGVSSSGTPAAGYVLVASGTTAATWEILPYTDISAGSTDGMLLYSGLAWTTPSLPSCTASTCCLNYDPVTHTPGANNAISAAVAPAGSLTGTTLASNVVISSITTTGTIDTGVWHSTAVGAAYGGTGIDTSAATGVVQVASGTWSVGLTLQTAVQDLITRVGTVLSGVWHATAIANTYGGTGLDTSAATGIPSVAAGTWSVGTAPLASLPVATLTTNGVTIKAPKTLDTPPASPSIYDDEFESTTLSTQWLPIQRGGVSDGVGTLVWTYAQPWAQSTTYSIASPSYVLANGNVYKCSQTGTSSGAGTGPSSGGSGIVDGTAKWDFQSTPSGVWIANHAYNVLGYSFTNSFYTWVVKTTGTSAAVTEPAGLLGTSLFAGTVDPSTTQAATLCPYDLTTRPGVLMMQPNSDQATYAFTEPVAWPSTAVVYGKVNSTFRIGSVAVNDAMAGIYISDGPIWNTAVGVRSYVNGASGPSFLFTSSANGAAASTSNWVYPTASTSFSNPVKYMAIVKNGTTYTGWVASDSGVWFQPTGTTSYVNAGTVSQLHVWGSNALATAPGNMYSAWEYIRVKLNTTILP